MKMATTPEEQRLWMAQWRETGVFLEEVRRHDLMTLTDLSAWEQIESLQGGRIDAWRNPHEPCGLIAQQAAFHRQRG